jgi:riboflavin synthase
MFSGIIQSLGTVEKIIRANEKAEMTIRTESEFKNFELGESIAVNGVCLTVRDFGKHNFVVDVSTETLSRTGFMEIKEGARVNLERSLTPSQKISGHFVSGHVDQMGKVVDIENKSGEILFRFEHPAELGPYIIEKGSIAIDGISLTVFSCRDNRFSVSVIPFTHTHTNMSTRKIGDLVNIECDMIGKYVYKACETLMGSSGKGQKVSLDLLRQKGFI